MRLIILIFAVVTTTAVWAQRAPLNSGDPVTYKGQACKVIRPPDEFGITIIRLPTGKAHPCGREELSELNNPSATVPDQPETAA